MRAVVPQRPARLGRALPAWLTLAAGLQVATGRVAASLLLVALPAAAGGSAGRLEIAATELVFYSAPGCRYCVQARKWLQEHAVPYVECDVQRVTRCADELVARGGRGVPHFVLHDRDLPGYDPVALARLTGRP